MSAFWEVSLDMVQDTLYAAAHLSLGRVSHNWEAIVPGVSQNLTDFGQWHLLLKNDHGVCHDVVHRDEVQADSGLGTAVQNRHTLDLQYGVIQAVTDGICDPFGYDDCYQKGQHHAYVIADLRGTCSVFDGHFSRFSPPNVSSLPKHS